ncbi:MAG: MFS transporter [Proteobacteria bacterium]|nr:MFS transporter [Pseudomonadota bacterium]
MMSRRSGSIYPILAVNFVGSLGFSIVLPFLVFLVTRWGGNALIYGVMGATYSVFQLVGAPLLGRWSDIYGRRKILLLSQLGTLASWAVFIVAFALPDTALLAVDSGLLGEFAVTLPLIVLFLARAFDGLTGGNVSVANAYLSDISSDEDRNANFGKMAVSANLGFILGPAIAGVLGGTAWAELPPVLAAVVISLAATLIIVYRLPESNPCVLRKNPERVNVGQVLGPDHKPCFDVEAQKPPLWDILRLTGVPLLLTIYFLVMLGFNFFYIAFPVYAVESLVWSVRDTGVFFSVLSFFMVLVQGPVLGRVSRWWDEGPLAVFGSLILAASFIFFGSRSLYSLYLGAALLALGNGLMWPSVVAILSRAAGDRFQGAVQGLASSFGAVASIMGLVIGGVLFGLLGAGVFYLSAGIIALVFLLSLSLLAAGKRFQPNPDRDAETRQQ